ncbi:MAG: phosphatase PAP2 family protein [Bacteroidetes bacterium]|nr:phosphatase PAP2 family protein [Bacteroidota bacterium]
MRKNIIVICASTVLAVFFIVLTINVLNGNMDAWNVLVYWQIAAFVNPVLTNIMMFLHYAGKWYVYLSIGILFLIIPRFRKNIGIPLTLSVIASGFLTFVLKQGFAIERPGIYSLVSVSGYGHPSGHVTYGTAFIGMCVFLFLHHANKKFLKICAITFSAIFMLLMGFSRIYLGVHTPTDIIAGYLAGTFAVILCNLIWRLKKC